MSLRSKIKQLEKRVKEKMPGPYELDKLTLQKELSTWSDDELRILAYSSEKCPKYLLDRLKKVGIEV